MSAIGLRGLFVYATAALVGAGCASDGTNLDETADTESPATSTTDPPEGSTGADEPGAQGRCEYDSVFTQQSECREYTGSAWTAEDITADCDRLMGEASLGQACATGGMLGRCVLDGGTADEYRIVTYGDADACGDQRLGCETFGGGVWEPAEVCEGDSAEPGGSGGGGDEQPFIQPTLECRDPLPGEPAGQSADGQVCTWQLISAATEEGRRYEDYADCGVVLTQRPYAPIPPNDDRPAEDPRLEDSAYVAELDWVESQIEATACVCCHSDIAPDGASNWTIDAPGNWVNSFFDSGLAMAAGWIDSSSFGAYPPEANNGFDRVYGIPSTDPERMRAFFEAELAYRGRTEADFADAPPFGGPLYTQLIYEPGRCEKGEGVDEDDSVHWTGGEARYVFILEAGSANPTVPPNLDRPDGTLWRIDVPADGEPILSEEVRYGEPPSSMIQQIPSGGAAPALVPGQDYYIYVNADIIVPITRCIFTY